MASTSIRSSDYLSDVLGKPPTLSSQKANWQDVSFEQNHVPAGKSPEFNFTHHAVGVNTTQHINCEFRAEGKQVTQPLLTGEFMLIPSGLTVTTSPDRPTVVASVNLSNELLVRNSLELWDIEKFELIPRSRAGDPFITQVIKALHSELVDNPDGCPVYSRTMANVLAVHLLKKFSNRSGHIIHPAGTLSNRKLKVVLDYIDSHIEQRIELVELAALIGYSQYHFSRSFKNSTGTSPHQYIIQQRIEKSKRLLKQSNLTVNEISIDCGFANPSHFAKRFREHTGISPQQFRKL